MNYEKELIEFKTPLLLAASAATGSDNQASQNKTKVGEAGETGSECPYTKLDDTADNFESQAGDEETDDTQFMKGYSANPAFVEGGGDYTMQGSPKH